uniref:RNA helicase aquarius-like n=1 Tax=Styela clava TaxID=7725 RepID=UPI001939CE73|nr:RNA helicase aquarius-like [Styela clava]
MPKQSARLAPTTEQMLFDPLTKLASKHWSNEALEKSEKFQSSIIEKVFSTEIVGKEFIPRRLMMLEFSRYLENYLWPNFTPETSTHAFVMSIVCMVNEKRRESVPAWEVFIEKPEHFGHFFTEVMKIVLNSEHPIIQRTVCIVFLNHCYNSIEVDVVRLRTLRTLTLGCWKCLLPERLESELKKSTKLKKLWKSIAKKDAKASDDENEKSEFDRSFLRKLMDHFLTLLFSTNMNDEAIDHCQRFLQLMIDLDSCLVTRRNFNTLLDDAQFVVRCRQSQLYKNDDVFSQLVENLAAYAVFEVNDLTGEALTEQEMLTAHYDRMQKLQRCAFSKFPNLKEFALGTVVHNDKREALNKHFGALSLEEMKKLCDQIVMRVSEEDDKRIILEMLINKYERRPSQLEAINRLPLYPTEKVLWDENLTKTENFFHDRTLALPKLNLQFLTLHDYLLRNFNLFRLESAYEIKSDIEDAVKRLQPYPTNDGSSSFGGWSRMALPIQAFNVVEVAKPDIAESCPSQVRADVTIALSSSRQLRAEWENLRKHDVCVLLSVTALEVDETVRRDRSVPFLSKYHVVVRGCEIEGMLDSEGHVIEEGPEPKPQLDGNTRTYRIWLDTNQYQDDMEAVLKDGEQDPYETFNVIMRRKPKENNFKAVLATIRNLMNVQCVVPTWLHDVLLGYGDPGAANYKKLGRIIDNLDWNDTFLSLDHLKEAFPGYDVSLSEDSQIPIPPFKLSFPEDKKISVTAHVIPNRGPYPFNAPQKNTIRFTPTQTEAIRSGMQPGLTMVVGPPGTGKTDVAVQIISNLYHNFPEQRTLIVTHSNQALNQLFEKLIHLDIDERHLLRLGHGEEELDTEKDFSRYGRVNYVLTQRLALLKDVGRLQESLGVPGDVSYTCETASHFFKYQVLSRWEQYQHEVKNKNTSETVSDKFPFHSFFAAAPQPLFPKKDFEHDWDIAQGCFRHIKNIFEKLQEYRAFELLRSGLDRSHYLLVKSAKIIAMTCTHAALKRQDLTKMDFKYDNILMEESAQILEIETFIPLLLQNPSDGYNRLKRWIMIGDHHQLPPVIKNMAFQRLCNMEQSLFARLVRLGVPTVDLDAQGRARPSIRSLYSWRYKVLRDLPHVLAQPEFKMFNPGFVFDFQVINVEDYNGVGESEPNPYFYQNLAEAEYCVGVFMYMRLLGYPSSEITILTTYNGQKHLIRDVVRQRCGDNPLIGWPDKITTVDRFQGQQNNYILLSLVRTKTVGHIRDVRRLIVAMSRARLGLYIFARVPLFRNCFELSPAFKQLLMRPMQLELLTGETYPPKTLRNTAAPKFVIKDMAQMHQYVYDMYLTIVKEMNKQKVAFQSLAEPPEPTTEDDKENKFEEVPIAFEVEPPVSETKDMEQDEANSAQQAGDEKQQAVESTDNKAKDGDQEPAQSEEKDVESDANQSNDDKDPAPKKMKLDEPDEQEKI